MLPAASSSRRYVLFLTAAPCSSHREHVNLWFRADVVDAVKVAAVGIDIAVVTFFSAAVDTDVVFTDIGARTIQVVTALGAPNHASTIE